MKDRDMKRVEDRGMKRVEDIVKGLRYGVATDLFERMKGEKRKAKDLTLEQAARELAGWHLGDPHWYDEFKRWVEAFGGRIIWPSEDADGAGPLAWPGDEVVAPNPYNDDRTERGKVEGIRYQLTGLKDFPWACVLEVRFKGSVRTVTIDAEYVDSVIQKHSGVEIITVYGEERKLIDDDKAY